MTPPINWVYCDVQVDANGRLDKFNTQQICGCVGGVMTPPYSKFCKIFSRVQVMPAWGKVF